MSSTLRPSYPDACREWAERVRADKEQVDRLREAPDGPDFYGPIAAAFKADPHRTEDPVLNIVRDLIVPGETWLDIGAGGGRFTLPIALRAGRAIALDPSEGMLQILREGMAEHAISNIDIVQSRWPAQQEVRADCSYMSFVGNDIEDIGPFVDAMEHATRRMCIFVNLEKPPPSAFQSVWLDVHREPRALLPSLPEFLALLLAKRRLFEVRLVPRQVQTFDSPEQVMSMARRQTWVQEGSEKDRILQQSVRDRLIERNGKFAFSWDPVFVGIVTWDPNRTS